MVVPPPHPARRARSRRPPSAPVPPLATLAVLTVLWLLATPAAVLAVPTVRAAGDGRAATEQPSDDDQTAPGPSRPEEGEVIRLYRSALGRQPDSDGFRYWVTRRIEGVPLVVVADSFLVSREFQLRFRAGSDAQFVDLVYHNVLGRLGDDAGVAYWRHQLAAGLTRHHLVLLFSESEELRHLTGTELAELPPFTASVRPVTVSDLGPSWRPGCPVAPPDLRAVRISHVGYDGRAHEGTLVVHRSVTADVVAVFGQLYQARFPLFSVRPVSEFGGDDDASMAADNTSGFNCRPTTGGTRWSRHAYGLAIDLNPVENPYVADRVLPPAGAAHVDRRGYHPGMIRPGDVVVRAFAAIGWRWGGDFRTVRDYQHVERP